MRLPSAEPGVFRATLPLTYTDADASGHVRLTSLLNLMQVQAGDHTTSRGFDYRTHKDQGIFWVLSRLSVRFDRWPTWPCAVTVDTWARATKAVFALRDFRLGTEDGWAARASSAWVLLKDRKPQRPEPWVTVYDQVRPEDPVAELPQALPALDSANNAERQAEALIRRTHGVYADWEDLDLNGHVNNVNAIAWCVSQHDFAFLSTYRPQSLDANYLAEMFCGEKFSVLLEERPTDAGARAFDYSVVREPDQVETLRLRIRYQQF